MRQPISIEAIVFKKNPLRFLLLKRIPSRHGFWQAVTGGLENDETKEQALYREIKEEIELEPTNIVNVIPDVYTFNFEGEWENKKHAVEEFVFGIEVKEDFKPVISGEHDEYRWCSFEQAIELLKHEKNKEAFQKLKCLL